MPRRVAAWITPVWGTAIVAAALWLKYVPPTPGTLLARLANSEPAHIVAHAFLYGMLAALARIATRRWWPSALIVALFAITQEAAQTVWWGRGFASPELFDFGVDAAAAAIVLVGFARAERVDAANDRG